MFAMCRRSPSNVLSCPLQFTFNELKCLFLACFAAHPFTPHAFWVMAATRGRSQAFRWRVAVVSAQDLLGSWGSRKGSSLPPGRGQQPHVASPQPELLAESKSK